MPLGAGQFSLKVDSSDEGSRLDLFIASKLGDQSRSFITWLIQQGHVAVDDKQRKPGYKLKTYQRVEGRIPESMTVDLVPENKPLDILFEDESLIVLNKPPGLVVHPSPGHPSETLVNRLLHHCPDLPGIKGEKRPGIVHRLDKETSGVLVVAKDAVSLKQLGHQFKNRETIKTYIALVHGIPPESSGVIQLPIGRHPVDRKKMAVTENGREAHTQWRIAETFKGASLLEVVIKTGRTHQIRVHCKAMGHPIIGDRVYAHRKSTIQVRRAYCDIYPIIIRADRQMLHAHRLSIRHPVSQEILKFEAVVPADMQHLLDELRRCVKPNPMT